MTTQTTLPQGFAALEPFVAYWAAPSLAERDTRRLDSTEAQRLAFYEAARDIAPAAFDYLNAKAFAAYDEADHRLLDLMLALIHVALAVEIERGERARTQGPARTDRRLTTRAVRATPGSLAPRAGKTAGAPCWRST